MPSLLSFLSLGEQSIEGRWSLLWLQVLAVEWLCNGLGPAAGLLWGTSLPISKEAGPPPDPDLPSSVITTVTCRMDNRETQMHVQTQTIRPSPLRALHHPPFPHQKQAPLEAAVVSWPPWNSKSWSTNALVQSRDLQDCDVWDQMSWWTRSQRRWEWPQRAKLRMDLGPTGHKNHRILWSQDHRVRGITKCVGPRDYAVGEGASLAWNTSIILYSLDFSVVYPNRPFIWQFCNIVIYRGNRKIILHFLCIGCLEGLEDHAFERSKGPSEIWKWRGSLALQAILASLKGAWEDRGVPGSLISFYLPWRGLPFGVVLGVVFIHTELFMHRRQLIFTWLFPVTTSTDSPT